MKTDRHKSLGSCLKRAMPFLSAVMLIVLSLTGCEEFSEWEVRVSNGRPIQEATPRPGMGTGPSLADYFNEGIEEAKENGLYHETDYSDIRPGNGIGNPGANGSGQLMYDSPELSGYLSHLEYDGEPYVTVNDGVPYFTAEELAMTDAFEYYSELDDLGRVQYAFALLDESLMPEDGEERGDISSVKPTGWVQAKYDFINNGGWLYNRCHLIAWSLAGENANKNNLMTGTRYFNVSGMLPFEMEVLGYLDSNPGSHVLYRATPVFDGDELLARGLLLEAYSTDDGGEVCTCVYIFNVQPEVIIDYATGGSHAAE